VFAFYINPFENLYIFAKLTLMKNRVFIKDLKAHAGKEVTIKGWIDVRRDQGKMIFFDFRDMTGKVQGVILPSAPDAHAMGSTVRSEWVVEVSGKVNNRPPKKCRLIS